MQKRADIIDGRSFHCNCKKMQEEKDFFFPYSMSSHLQVEPHSFLSSSFILSPIAQTVSLLSPTTT